MIADCLEKIRDYTRRDDRLRKSTICSFDVRLPELDINRVDVTKADSIDIVVFGLNEAEYDPADSIIKKYVGEVLEDNSEKNFREFCTDDGPEMRRAKEQSQAEAWKWYRKVRSFIGSDISAVLGEFFFWSSVNTKADFVGRYGTSFVKSPHLEFCRNQNLILLQHYKPKLVAISGSEASRCDRLAEASLYDLRPDRDREPLLLGKYMVRFYRERATGRPWMFSPHFSNAYGVSKTDKAKFRGLVIRELGTA